MLVGNRKSTSCGTPCVHSWELPDPSLQAAGVRGFGAQRRLQRTSSDVNEQRAQVDVAAQADMSEPRPAARSVLAAGSGESQAPNWRPFLKTFASGTVAASALEVTGPTPRSSLARLATSLLLACSGDLLITARESQGRQLLTDLQEHRAHGIRQPGVFNQVRQRAEEAVRRARDDHPEFSQQPTGPIQQCRTFSLPAFTHAVPRENRLLLDGFDRHKAHRGLPRRNLNGLGIRS